MKKSDRLVPIVPLGAYFMNPNNSNVYFPASITQGSKGNEAGIQFLRRKLTDHQFAMFKEDIFGKFVDLKGPNFKNIVVHEVIFRQVAKPNHMTDEQQIWFQIGDHLTRFSIEEWCLVTGLLCHPLPKMKANGSGQHRLRTKFFSNCKKLGEVDERIQEIDFRNKTVIKDDDALKIALYYFVDRVLFARKSDRTPKFEYLDMVDDLSYFRAYPWGRKTWDCMYIEIDKALENSAPRYNVCGFTAAFQAWIFEAVGALATKWGVRTDKVRPRVLKWKVAPPKNLGDKHSEVVKFFRDPGCEWDVRQTLVPTTEELASDYFRSLPFRLPIGKWVGLHNPSINLCQRVLPKVALPVSELLPATKEHPSVADLGADHENTSMTEEDEDVEEEDISEAEEEIRPKSNEDRLYRLLQERFDHLQAEIQASHQLLQSEIRSSHQQLQTSLDEIKTQMTIQSAMMAELMAHYSPGVFSCSRNTQRLPLLSYKAPYEKDKFDDPSLRPSDISHSSFSQPYVITLPFTHTPSQLFNTPWNFLGTKVDFNMPQQMQGTPVFTQYGHQVFNSIKLRSLKTTQTLKRNRALTIQEMDDPEQGSDTYPIERPTKQQVQCHFET